MPVVYVYSCTLWSVVMHIGAGYVVVIVVWVTRTLVRRMMMVVCVFYVFTLEVVPDTHTGFTSMKREIGFLTGYISECILESKLNKIENPFIDVRMLDEVPNAAGIYIMFARNTDFVYPKRKSRVIYIGTSNNLQRRLKTHLRNYIVANEDFNTHAHWNYSRYNYIVAFGCDIYYMRITGRESEKELERKALEGFYDKYGALPVGNGAFSFGR